MVAFPLLAMLVYRSTIGSVFFSDETNPIASLDSLSAPRISKRQDSKQVAFFDVTVFIFSFFDLNLFIYIYTCVYIYTYSRDISTLCESPGNQLISTSLHQTLLPSLPPHSNPLFQKPKLLRSGFQIGRLPRDSFHIGSRDDIHQRKETYSYTPDLHTLGCPLHDGTRWHHTQAGTWDRDEMILKSEGFQKARQGGLQRMWDYCRCCCVLLI